MLFDIINASLENLVIHHIGNWNEGEDNSYSKNVVRFGNDSEMPDLLKQYFFASFGQPCLYNFVGTASLSDNRVYEFTKSIFEDTNTFYENSRLIADHLYNNSTHPSIKSGELYVTLFKDVKIFDTDVRALGIFKSEHKDTFLKVYSENEDINVGYDEGFDLKKLDKGCVIFDIESENGYVVALLDKTSGKSEQNFWKNNFLGLEVRNDNNFQTKEYLNLCKSFVQDVFHPSDENPDIQKADQSDMLNRQIAYFKENKMFNEDRFKEDVLGNNEDLCEAFNEHKAKFEETNDCILEPEFAINPDVVKKSQSGFKSVIKLDKNFHLYVHGNRELVERGFDREKSMYYYKLYFETES